ncbi:MAG: DUF3592 domain-containing protein [Candidatus Pacebacteria bacterium]|nr:DUF3592 domain-containing protein [Candidatus Paceibacterota bacterium]
MRKRFKKSAFFLFVIGFIIFVISLYFGFREYRIITTGEEITGRVSQIITINSDDGTTYKPEIRYQFNNQSQLYTPSYSSSYNAYQVGEEVTLLVSNNGVTIKGFNGNLVGIAVGFVIGLVMWILGLHWFIKHRKNFDEAARLKRYGRRVQARFIKRESSNMKINNQQGAILYFQEEGGDAIFHTKPIYSEFSIKWLEEHPFDVYVDTRDSSKYFVDLEKHFGHPEIQ